MFFRRGHNYSVQVSDGQRWRGGRRGQDPQVHQHPQPSQVERNRFGRRCENVNSYKSFSREMADIMRNQTLKL